MDNRIVLAAISDRPGSPQTRRNANHSRWLAAIVFCASSLLGSMAPAAGQAQAAPQTTSQASSPNSVVPQPGVAPRNEKSGAAQAAHSAKTKPVAKVEWRKIPSAERKVLANVEKDWDKLSGVQQRRLLAAAKEYPKLTPAEQARFQERLKGWTSLSHEERAAVREKYKTLKNLPPEKQKELQSRWQQGKTAPPSPATPSSPPTGGK